MLALNVAAVKQLAVAVVIVLVVGAVAAAAIIRSIVTKVLMVVILAGLALTVWSQRSNLESCANRVRSASANTDVTCSFFGVEVDVPE